MLAPGFGGRMSKIDGVEVVVGPRVLCWSCRNGCGVVEWHEDSGKPCMCPRCGADSNDGKCHGIYTVTSTGDAGEPFKLKR